MYYKKFKRPNDIYVKIMSLAEFANYDMRQIYEKNNKNHKHIDFSFIRLADLGQFQGNYLDHQICRIEIPDDAEILQSVDTREYPWWCKKPTGHFITSCFRIESGLSFYCKTPSV